MCSLQNMLSQFKELRNAIVETFNNRKTPMSMDSLVFGDEFLNDPMHQTRWNSFLKKKKALIQITMNEAMERIKIFVRPLLEDTSLGGSSWNPDIGLWE